nr:MAG TPA: hypothetical protein [Caudoviricetes sp.]
MFIIYNYFYESTHIRGALTKKHTRNKDVSSLFLLYYGLLY